MRFAHSLYAEFCIQDTQIGCDTLRDPHEYGPVKGMAYE